MSSIACAMSGAMCQMHAERQRRQRVGAADRHGGARGRRLVSERRPGERLRFGVGHHPLAIHCDAIEVAKVAEAARVRRARRDLAEADGLERGLHPGKRVALRRAVHGADQQLLRSAAGRNQSDADFNQPDVAFRGGLHAIAVQTDFAPAADGETGRRDDHGHRRELQSHGGVLEGAHHQVDLVPVALLRLEEQQHQVGAR